LQAATALVVQAQIMGSKQEHWLIRANAEDLPGFATLLRRINSLIQSVMDDLDSIICGQGADSGFFCAPKAVGYEGQTLPRQSRIRSFFYVKDPM
jgi:hypothetical protein